MVELRRCGLLFWVGIGGAGFFLVVCGVAVTHEQLDGRVRWSELGVWWPLLVVSCGGCWVGVWLVGSVVSSSPFLSSVGCSLFVFGGAEYL